MSPTHVWVIEIRLSKGWIVADVRDSREAARRSQKFTYRTKETRIRKYVPA